MPKRAVSITLDPTALDQLHAWRQSKGGITLSEAVTILVQLFTADTSLQEKVWERSRKGQEVAKEAARKARKEQMDAAWKKWLNPETRAEGEQELHLLRGWTPAQIEDLARTLGYHRPESKPRRQARPVEVLSPPLSPPQECGRV